MVEKPKRILFQKQHDGPHEALEMKAKSIIKLLI